MVAAYVDPRDAEIEKLKDFINAGNMCVFGLLKRLAEADVDILNGEDEHFAKGVLMFGYLTRKYLTPEVVEAMKKDSEEDEREPD